jgi:Tol biopolymer transport system component
MRNGSIDVFGAMQGVRALTPRGKGKFIFDCTGSCPEVRGADWSPDGTLLAFASDHPRGGTYDGLHVVEPARGTDRLLVPGEEIYQPAWSPDGTRIAYVQLRQIFVVNEDGSGRTLVATINGDAIPSQPSWSPGGSHIVYAAGGRLYVVGLDGSAPSPLVKGFDPAWSPNGNTIAYVGGGDLKSPRGCDIRETTPAGRHDSTLVDLSTVPGPKRCELAFGLEWSPDGTRLALVVLRQPTPRSLINAAVFVVRTEGSSARLLTPRGAHPGWWGLTWQPVPLPSANTRPVFQRTVTIGGLTITSPSDWILVDYWGLWDSDAVSLDNTAVPLLELTNFDPGLSAPVCDSTPGEPTRFPADGVAILVMVGNGDENVAESCGGDIQRTLTGTIGWGGPVPYRVVLAIGPNTTEGDRANADEIWRSIAWVASLRPYTRGRTPRYVLDGWQEGAAWRLLEARPLRGGVELSEIDLDPNGAGSGGHVYSDVPSPIAIEGGDAGWLGAVTEDAAKVEFYRERGGAPIQGQVLDLPPSLPFAFDAWWFRSALGQTWGGEAVAVGHDGKILGSTLPPLVQSMQVGTVRAFGARWQVKASRSADGYDDQACVEPSSAPTSHPCERPLGGGLSVQTFGEPAPASFLSVVVGNDIGLEIRMHDGTTLLPVRFPAWNGAAVAVFVLEGTGSGRLIYHYSDNGSERHYDGPVVKWPARS